LRNSNNNNSSALGRAMKLCGPVKVFLPLWLKGDIKTDAHEMSWEKDWEFMNRDSEQLWHVLRETEENNENPQSR
jgi:hypothetical protein